MIKCFYLLTVLSNIFLLSSCSFFSSPSVDTFAKSITANNLKRHLEVISSDSLEGREMATEGERKAAAYISNTFEKLQLLKTGSSGSYLHGFTVARDSFISGTFSTSDSVYTISSIALGFKISDSISNVSSNALAFVGYGIDDPKYSDYRTIDVKDKIVLFYYGEPTVDTSRYLISGGTRRSSWSNFRSQLPRKLAAAKSRGAKAAIILTDQVDTVSRSASQYNSFSEFHPILSADDSSNLDHVIITRPISRRLLGTHYPDVKILLKKELGFESFVMTEQVQWKIHEATLHRNVNNVIGFIEGTDKKNEYIIISAHYDHLGKHNGRIFHGADDNGSGTCGLMGIAEAFSKATDAGFRPRRSIVFLSVTGEEKGLYGSKDYVAHPVFPLEKTVVDINTDMIGRFDVDHEKGEQYIYVIGDDKLSSELRGINEANNALHTKLLLDYKYNGPKDPNRFYYRSDHYEFAQKGIPIIFYFDGIHKDYHKPTDTVEKIDFNIMEKRARLAFYTAWDIANREGRLKADRTGD